MKKTAWVLLLCLVLSFVMSGCKKEKTGGLENYEIGPDRLPSVTFVVGERKLIETENEEDGVVSYKYKTEEAGYMDIYEYMSYLIDNCGGVVTRALNEGEEGECEIAIESEENGYVVKMEFEYEENEFTITLKRVAGKLKKTT